MVASPARDEHDVISYLSLQDVYLLFDRLKVPGAYRHCEGVRRGLFSRLRVIIAGQMGCQLKGIEPSAV